MLKKKREKEEIIKKYKISFWGTSLEKLLFRNVFPKDKKVELVVYNYNLFFSMMTLTFDNLNEFLKAIDNCRFLVIRKVYETPTKIVMYTE